MPATSPTLSLRQYGNLRGVSGEAVRKAIKTGRLVKAVSYDDKGWPRVDPKIAELEWPPGRASVDPTAPHVLASIEEVLEAQRVEIPKIDPDGEIPDPSMELNGSPAAAMAKNRAIREAYEARLKKLDWEQKSGLLVEAEAVKSEAFKLARTVRDSMLNIPDRIAAELAAESDTFRVHARLTEEIRKVLEGFGNE